MQRLGPSKNATQAVDQSSSEPVFDLDSPPVTPKSVRPPLEPEEDYELRLACAFILQDLKSSDEVYEERYGGGHDAATRSGHTVAKDSTNRPIETVARAPSKSYNRSRLVRTQSERIASRRNPVYEESKPSKAKHTPIVIPYDPLAPKDTAVREALKPAIKKEAALEPVEAKSVRVHKRSNSNPSRPILIASKSEPIERPRTAARSGSIASDVSTPFTDATEGLAHSTAPTSTAITPARGSVRQEGQARLSGNENFSHTKFLASDTELMIRELEGLRKMNGESRAQQDLEDQVLASTGAGATPGRTKPPPTPVSNVPRRKPVPASQKDGTRAMSHKRSNSSQSSHIIQPDGIDVPPVPTIDSRISGDHARSESQTIPLPHLDSRQSAELVRSESKRRQSAPRSESRQEMELRSESRLSRYDRPTAKDSVPPSRSSSLSNAVKDIFRGRRPSIDQIRPASRARSTDSTRSGLSVGSSTSRWRSWRPFHRGQDSGEISRPGTSDSAIEDEQQPQRKKKPAINLNRELPPLPSLDQWKPVEPEKPKHIADMASPKSSMSKDSNGASVRTEANIARRRSKATHPPRTSSKRTATTVGQVTLARQASVGRAHVVNHTKRTASVRTPQSGQDSAATNPLVAPRPNTANGETETSKRDLDSYAEEPVQPSRPRAETKALFKSSTADLTALPVAEKAEKKKRWWQSSRKAKKEETWMDRVVRSGSRSGLMEEDGTGTPVVRY